MSGAALVGWWMGGQIALEALPALRGRVAALALVSSTPRFAAAPGWLHGLAEVSVHALAAGLERRPEKTLQRFFEGMFVPDELDGDARAAIGQRVLAGAPPRDVVAARAGLDALLAADHARASPRWTSPPPRPRGARPEFASRPRPSGCTRRSPARASSSSPASVTRRSSRARRSSRSCSSASSAEALA